VGEGSDPPVIAVSSTTFGEMSSVLALVPLVVSRTGMSSVKLLPCTARVTTPVYVPDVSPAILPVILNACVPFAVEPDVGVTFNHGDKVDAVAVNERFASPVLEIATNTLVPELSSMTTELGLAFRAGLLLTVRTTGRFCEGIALDLTVISPTYLPGASPVGSITTLNWPGVASVTLLEGSETNRVVKPSHAAELTAV